MKVVFMGTPDFAVPTLEKLYECGYDVECVFSQPDKPKGRGYKLTPPPVKVVAESHNTKVLQPVSLKKDADEYINELKTINPDVIVVAAYGKILPKEVLDIPKYGCVNVHGSLLPKYRGAGPIQWSVLNDEKETGVTTMLMAEGLDTGDILYEKILSIGENETSGELFDRMAISGGEALIHVIKNIENITPKKQIGEPLYAEMITKEEAHIDWKKDTNTIINLIRGMNPVPLAYTYYKDEAVKLTRAVSYNLNEGTPGEIISVSDEGIVIRTGDGAVLVNEVRFPGKRTMTVSEYLRGNEIIKGEILA